MRDPNIKSGFPCYGIAICNFGSKRAELHPGSSHFIEATVGESITVLNESGDWYFIFKVSNQNEQGIIPKSYIHIRESTLVKHKGNEILVPKRTPLLQEITDVLKEWHNISKQYYLEGRSQFFVVRSRIIELHDKHKEILGSNPTVEGLKDLSLKTASIIDSGNKLLGLEMRVRDLEGRPLDPNRTSPIYLFKEHQHTSEKLEKQFAPQSIKRKHSKYQSSSLFLTLDRVTWKIPEEVEVRFFIYDGDQNTDISEGAQISLSVGANNYPFRFLFTDLSRRDQESRKIFLLAYVVRIGGMEYIEPSPGKPNYPTTPFSSSKSGFVYYQKMKRPWGLGAIEITNIFSKDYQSNPQNILLPFYPYGENYYDSFKVLLSKILETPIGVKEPERGFFFLTLTLLDGTPCEISEDDPVVLRSNPTIVRRMGFPEVILPNDRRNDLYVTLVSGEFHKGTKPSDKNIEVTVTAHNSTGDIIPGILLSGVGSPPIEEYKSVVYYHESKPKWDEIFKLSLPMFLDQFSKAHLKFTFKHRSSRESKDVSEKPFALCYARLRLDNGTAIADGEHKLAIFKVDQKLYRDKDVHYLHLPSTLSGGHSAKRSAPGLTWSPKDSFVLKTTLISTQFTQNDHLLELLQWTTSIKKMASSQIADESTRSTLSEMLFNNLKKSLQNVMRVNGEEIMKFLPYVFNALFSILVESIDSVISEIPIHAQDQSSNNSAQAEECDRHVFDCLIYIFGMILDHKFQNFRSVLDHYVEEEFSATMAYKKLSKELIRGVSPNFPNPDRTLKIMKSLEFFIKFIVKSFSIRIKLREMEIDVNEEADLIEEDEFEASIESLFGAMKQLLSNKELNFINAQKGCLKYVPTLIQPLSTVYSPRRLSELFVELIAKVDKGRLTIPKLTAILEIVKSSLFKNPDCRTTLIPIIASNMQQILPGNDEDMKRKSEEYAKSRSRNKLGKIIGYEGEGAAVPLIATPQISIHSAETKKCVELLGEILEVLYSNDIGPTGEHIFYITQILLRDIVYSIGIIGYKDAMAGNMVAILVSLLKQMPNGALSQFLRFLCEKDGNNTELFKFINDILLVFRDIFSQEFFHRSWSAMIQLQNIVLLRILEELVDTIISECLEPFEFSIWNNLFSAIVAFITQDSLQLENLSALRKDVLISSCDDMRLRGGELIRSVWFTLSERRRKEFVSSGVVGIFLQMGLLPQSELRKITILIFFDMIRSEFATNQSFSQVEDELIFRLVDAIESGKGDLEFRDIFYETMKSSCENDHTGLRDSGLEMVETLTKLIELLLEYREVLHETDPGNKKTAIMNLLDFSQEVARNELYVRYLYKLHDLHIQSRNFTEAGFTLKLHTRMLEWTEDEVPINLQSLKHSYLRTHVELKEALYLDMISYFASEESKSWEAAQDVADELRQVYAEELYAYVKLPGLLRQSADLYEKILKEVRFEPGYFRVAFYGKGFPSFLQNKVFVYRGKRSEKLNDFESRLLERFSNAELLRSLNPPSEQQKNSGVQLLQVCTVEPVMEYSKRLSGMKYVEEVIKTHWKHNDVTKFVYSRPFHKEPKDTKNEFASLWLQRHHLRIVSAFPGIMDSFLVDKETSEQIKPICFGIETLREANEKFRGLILTHVGNPDEDMGSLSLKLNGVLDAAVMGGISNYEKAFFIPEYLEKEPGDAHLILTMKQEILASVPLIQECLRIHREKCPESLRPLHAKLEERYDEFIKHLQNSYADVCSNIRSLKDESLQRDIEHVQKKRLSTIYKKEKQQPLQRNNEGVRGSNAVLSRSKSSFSSTLSVYSGFSKSTTKSMVSLAKGNREMQRRSTQASFDEGNERGVLLSSFSSTKLSSSNLEEETIVTVSARNSSSFSSSSIPLTPNRLSIVGNDDIRRNLNGRSSWMSIESNTDNTSSRNSMESSSKDEDDMQPPNIPPPLPPKVSSQNNENEVVKSNTPPPLPPKKPPLPK